MYRLIWRDWSRKVKVAVKQTGLKAVARKFVDRVLGSLGFEIIRKEYNSYNFKYTTLIRELDGCFRAVIFPGLPPCPGRDRLIAGLVGTYPSEAMYVVNFLHRSLPLEGDVCEFGIAQGATSALLANEIRGTQKTLWLFDSFQGLPRPTEKDVLVDDIYNLGSIEMYAGTMAYKVDEVTQRLRAIDYPLARVKVVPGFIEETIKRAGLPERVCFAYVDFDFYEPISIALNFLHERLSPGGHVVVDDYGFFSAGAKTAVDEFLSAHAGRYDLALPHEFAGHFAILHRQA
jgi:O-methyltransferase